MTTLLVVEDDAHIRALLDTVLSELGYKVFTAPTGSQGLVVAKTQLPDAILLDLNLPDMSGIGFLDDLLKTISIPVIVISAMGEESTKVVALEKGADDYITKPFGIAELSARIKSVLRRSQPTQEPISLIRDLVVHWDRQQITRHNQPIRLSQTEFKLLKELLRSPGKIVTHFQLLRAVWGTSSPELVHYVRIYIGHLREKLETQKDTPPYIVTEPGIGYRFN